MPSKKLPIVKLKNTPNKKGVTMKKRILPILFAMVLLLSLSAPALAYDLVATGAAGTESRVAVEVESGSTLGDLDSISWNEYLDYGYAPHVDVILDTGGGTDAPVFEYAYNTSEGAVRPEGQLTYGSVTDGWYQTFNDDGNGPAVITDTAYAWLSSGPSGGIKNNINVRSVAVVQVFIP